MEFHRPFAAPDDHISSMAGHVFAVHRKDSGDSARYQRHHCQSKVCTHVLSSSMGIFGELLCQPAPRVAVKGSNRFSSMDVRTQAVPGCRRRRFAHRASEKKRSIRQWSAFRKVTQCECSCARLLPISLAPGALEPVSPATRAAPCATGPAGGVPSHWGD